MWDVEGKLEDSFRGNHKFSLKGEERLRCLYTILNQGEQQCIRKVHYNCEVGLKGRAAAETLGILAKYP